MVKNSGFAGNRFDKHPKAVATVSAALTGVVCCKMIGAYKKASFPGWAMLFAGAVSNTLERVLKGYVTDYIRIGKYEYNVADLMIYTGIAIIIGGELWEER